MPFYPTHRAGLLAALVLTPLTLHAAPLERIPMTAEEIRDYGGDPGAPGHYFKLAPGRTWDDDQDPPARTAGSLQGFTSQAADDFRPLDERQLFSRLLPSELTCDANSQESRAESQVQLPQDATLRFMRLFADDSNASHNLTVSLIERCQSTNTASNVTATVLGSVSTTGSSGRQVRNTEFPLFLTVDNLNCLYVLRAQMNSQINGCAAGLALNKVRLTWESTP